MYTVSDGIAKINGANGKYDSVINNPSVRYGRNAVANYYTYLDDYKFQPVEMPKLDNLAQLDEDKFEAKMSELDTAIKKTDEQIAKMPPVKFEYTYAQCPGGKLDVMSLMGASYGEMGTKSKSTKEFSKSLQKTFSKPNIFMQIVNNVKAFFKGQPREKLELHPVKMSVDAFDINKDKKIDIAEYSVSILVSDMLSNGQIDGTVTNRGENASLAYANAKNAAAAKHVAENLYNKYDLGTAQEEFLKDENNLVK